MTKDTAILAGAILAEITELNDNLAVLKANNGVDLKCGGNLILRPHRDLSEIAQTRNASGSYKADVNFLASLSFDIYTEITTRMEERIKELEMQLNKL